MMEEKTYQKETGTTKPAGKKRDYLRTDLRNVHGTVFDDVFRTMVQKMPKLLIPLINEVFQTDYSEEESFEQYRNEHEEIFGKVVTDSIIVIRNKTYHIECQSVDDSTMAIRMVEYDFAIALEQSVRSGRMYEMDFPESCVLYLRNSKNTPDVLQVKVNLPGGKSFVYEAKTIKLNRYTRNELFQKNLLVLLPFYILKYEKDKDYVASDEQGLHNLLADYEEIRKRLETEFISEKKSVLYTDIIDLIVRISDHVFAEKENVRKGVEEIMGGKVLELRSERLREEGREEGRAEGRAEGREEGRAEGREEGVESEKIASIKKLMKNGNMSLEQAMILLEIPLEEREQYEKRLE